MNCYAIFTFFYESGQVYKKQAFNFKARGTKHAQTIVDRFYDNKTQFSAFTLTGEYTVYFNKTNPAFEPNQLRHHRGKFTGAVSHSIANKSELI